MSKVLSFLLTFFFISPVFADGLAPLTVEGATTIDLYGVKTLHEQGATFIDLRETKEYEDGHITNAVNLNMTTSFSKDTLEATVSPDKDVVFYCYGKDCYRSASAARKAVNWGYDHVYYYRNGFPEWEAERLPVNRPAVQKR